MVTQSCSVGVQPCLPGCSEGHPSIFGDESCSTACHNVCLSHLRCTCSGNESPSSLMLMLIAEGSLLIESPAVTRVLSHSPIFLFSVPGELRRGRREEPLRDSAPAALFSQRKLPTQGAFNDVRALVCTSSPLVEKVEMIR